MSVKRPRKSARPRRQSNGWASKELSLLEYLSSAGSVKRYHAVPTIFQDTVGRHSWGVAALLWVMTAGRVSARLLAAAVLHDLVELDWGDLPSPVKRLLSRSARQRASFSELEADTYRVLPQLAPPALTAEERRLLKLADVFEGMLYCCTERAAGNRGPIRLVYRNYASYARPLIRTAEERVLFRQIDAGLWRRARL